MISDEQRFEISYRFECSFLYVSDLIPREIQVLELKGREFLDLTDWIIHFPFSDRHSNTSLLLFVGCSVVVHPEGFRPSLVTLPPSFSLSMTIYESMYLLRWERVVLNRGVKGENKPVDVLPLPPFSAPFCEWT